MIELLAPAGNFAKLKAALKFGADAVYAGGKNFSLRDKSGNFSVPEIREAVQYCHERGRKFYLAVNIFAHNQDMQQMPEYLAEVASAGIDALIVSDPGVLRLAKKHAPGIELHLSTQANTTNLESVHFWQEQGISRVVLARELHHTEIAQITQNSQAEIEVFVHGAVCMAYSGRCLISNYLADRSANGGDCSQSCRWNYELVEAKRPGEYFPVEEDARGTYFFNSNDLNLIEHIPLLIEAGVHSVKIEGRMKSENYVGTVVRAYRQAIDDYYQKKDYDRESLKLELERVSHRHYSTGFFLGKPGPEGQNYDKNMVINSAEFLGKILEIHGQEALVDVRGKFLHGETIQVMRNRLQDDFFQIIGSIRDEEGHELAFTKPSTRVRVTFSQPVEPDDILRRILA